MHLRGTQLINVWCIFKAIIFQLVKTYYHQVLLAHMIRSLTNPSINKLINIQHFYIRS